MISFPLSEVLSFVPTNVDGSSYGEQVYRYFKLERYKGTEFEIITENLRVSRELNVRMFMSENLIIDVLRFPKSRVVKFRKKFFALRYGQEFHNYMELYKVTDPRSKVVCDKIYNADSETAKALIKLLTDEEN